MLRFPPDPTLRVTKGPAAAVGLVALIFGAGFLVLAGVMSLQIHARGRFGLLPGMLAIALVTVIGLGFLDAAHALLRSDRGSRTVLLSNFTLYWVGGFFCLLPALLLIFHYSGVARLTSLREIATTLPAMGIGVLAIWLARSRNKNRQGPRSPAVPAPVTRPIG